MTAIEQELPRPILDAFSAGATPPRLRIGGLFEGYGGLTMAVAEVFGGDLAWYSEIDPGALKVLGHRFPDVPNVGDVRQVDWSTVAPVDVLCGGFPCQDVSAAGKRAGLMNGTRSGLWHEFARAIAALRPAFVVAENVRGLLSARGDDSEELAAAEVRVRLATNLREWLDDRRALAAERGRADEYRRLTDRAHRVLGCHRRAVAAARRAERRIVRAVGTVLGTLAGLGYDAVWVGLRAADVGAPHNRFRVFIVAADTARDPGRVNDRDRAVAADARVFGRQRWASLERGGRDSSQRREARSDAVNGRRAPLVPTPVARDVKGHNQRRDATSLTGALLPTPSVADGMGGHLSRSGDRSDELLLPGVAKSLALLPTPAVNDMGEGKTVEAMADVIDAGRWGRYAAAVDRWQGVTRPAPPPTEPGPKGGDRLSARFSEWLMGVPDGWITDVPGVTRNEALKLCGNGVVPQQALEGVGRCLAVMASW